MDENRTGRESRGNPPRRRRRRRMSLMGALLYVAFVIGVSVLLATFGWTLANDVLALNKVEHSAVITLPESIFETREEVDEDGEKTTVEAADMAYVADQLKENGLIEHKWLFKLFAALSGSDTKVRPGTYTLDTDLDYRALITNMGSTSANRATVSVTFVEGSTVDQIFALMEEKGVSTVEKLQDMAATHDYAFSFLQEIPLGDYHRLEGYLFPDTYTFYLSEDPLTAINKMLVNFDARFTEDMRAQVAETEYSIRDILTIASLIERRPTARIRRPSRRSSTTVWSGPPTRPWACCRSTPPWPISTAATCPPRRTGRSILPITLICTRACPPGPSPTRAWPPSGPP